MEARDCESCAESWRAKSSVYCDRWATPPGKGLAVALPYALEKPRCGPERAAWRPRAAGAG